MSLWTVRPNQNHDVYTVVYLLRDALKSALSDAWFFERTALQKVDLKGAGHAEIAAKLGRFRDSCKNFEEREALMVTKLLRARTWAAELRKLAPEFHPDIDQFTGATAPCEQLQAEFVKDAQRMFNGGTSLARFISRRRPCAIDAEPSGEASSEGHYLVGGQKALYELRVACEVFLSQIDGEFFASDAGKEVASVAFLEAEEALLLSDPLH